MRAAVRAGAAVYNDGYYHAAHDAWEDRWLDLESGTDDELLLHGLIQFTAAVYHARDRNWAGAVGLATSAFDYLSTLPGSYREVDVDRVRRALERLAADPEVIERSSPPALVVAGERPALAALGPRETAIAARVLAEEFGVDPAPIEHATEYALRDGDPTAETGPLLALLFDFVREDEHRDLVYRRLCEHVERRDRRAADVENLFD